MGSITQTNVLSEKDLRNSIKGYNGYEVPADRGESDKSLREFLSERLQQVEKALSSFEHSFYQNYKSANLSPFHRISLGLKMLIQSTILPLINNNNFFSTSKIAEDKIVQLNEYDIQLVNQVNILNDEIAALESINGEHEIDEILNHFYDLIDGANQILSEREFLIMSE